MSHEFDVTEFGIALENEFPQPFCDDHAGWNESYLSDR